MVYTMLFCTLSCFGAARAQELEPPAFEHWPEIEAVEVSAEEQAERVAQLEAILEQNGRRRAEDDPAVAYQPTCALGQHYDHFALSCGTGAMDMPITCEELLAGQGKLPCKDGDVLCQDFERTDCVEEVLGGSTVSYARVTTSKSNEEDLLNEAVKAEASYNGFKTSLSAGYMTDSMTESQSVSFYVGGTTTALQRNWLDSRKTRLSAAAKEMLQYNWRLFLNQFGKNFIQSIEHTATFIGSTKFTSESSHSKASLKVVAGISYDDLFEGTTANAGLTKIELNAARDLTCVSNARYSGFDRKVDLKEPIDLNDPFLSLRKLDVEYRNWQKDTSAKPEQFSTPTKMVVSWYLHNDDFKDTLIRSLVPKLSDIEWDLLIESFKVETPEDKTFALYNRELYLTKANLVTLDAAQKKLRDRCPVPEDAKKSVNAEVGEKIFKLRVHQAEAEGLTEENMFELQQEIKNGDWSFFLTLHNDEYDDLINEIDQLCAYSFWTDKQTFSACAPTNFGGVGVSVEACKEKCFQREGCGAITHNYPNAQNACYLCMCPKGQCARQPHPRNWPYQYQELTDVVWKQPELFRSCLSVSTFGGTGISLEDCKRKCVANDNCGGVNYNHPNPQQACYLCLGPKGRTTSVPHPRNWPYTFEALA